jgi:hypothetical protein
MLTPALIRQQAAGTYVNRYTAYEYESRLKIKQQESHDEKKLPGQYVSN